MNEPNHVCKNPKCGKKYYACDACDESANLNWRSVACSPECFKEYIKFIDERDNKSIDVKEEIVEKVVTQNIKTK